MSCFSFCSAHLVTPRTETRHFSPLTRPTERPLSLPSAAFNLFRRKSPPNAFDNFLHRKPKHRPASFPPPHSTFVTAKVCRMDLKMRENIPTPVHATAPQFFRYPLRLHPIQDTARLHGIPSLAGVRQERNRKTEQTGNTKPEKRCNTRENRKIELLLLRKNRFSRHRRQTLKASNTATDHHQATERPPEIAQSPPQTAKSHRFFASLPPLSRKNQRNKRQHPPLAHPRAHFFNLSPRLFPVYPFISLSSCKSIVLP